MQARYIGYVAMYRTKFVEAAGVTGTPTRPGDRRFEREVQGREEQDQIREKEGEQEKSVRVREHFHMQSIGDFQ